MPYREQSADTTLARWIECVWSLATREGIRAHPVRPDGCIDIVYSEASGLIVVGTMTHEQRFDVPPRLGASGIRFRPGMTRSFLHVPAGELTNRAVPLGLFWGRAAHELESRLAAARSAEDCCQILVAQLKPPDANLNHVQRAVETMTAAHGDLELGWIVRQAGMSDRQFRRRCFEETGLSPKQLCRILRFRRACVLGRRGLPWSLIAAESGYFDQAHLIRDFREFTGDTPTSVFSNTSQARFT